MVPVPVFTVPVPVFTVPVRVFTVPVRVFTVPVRVRAAAEVPCLRGAVRLRTGETPMLFLAAPLLTELLRLVPLRAALVRAVVLRAVPVRAVLPRLALLRLVLVRAVEACCVRPAVRVLLAVRRADWVC